MVTIRLDRFQKEVLLLEAGTLVEDQNVANISTSAPITKDTLRLFRIYPLSFWEEGELVKIANLSSYLVTRNDLPYAIMNKMELDTCDNGIDQMFNCSHKLMSLDTFPCERDVFMHNGMLRCEVRLTAKSCVVYKLSSTRFFLNNQRNVSIEWSCPGVNVTQYVQENTWIDIDPGCSLKIQNVNVWPPESASDRDQMLDMSVESSTDAIMGSLELQPPGFDPDSGFAKFFGKIGNWVQTNTERVENAYEIVKVVMSPWTYVKLILSITLFGCTCLLAKHVWYKLNK